MSNKCMRSLLAQISQFISEINKHTVYFTLSLYALILNFHNWWVLWIHCSNLVSPDMVLCRDVLWSEWREPSVRFLIEAVKRLVTVRFYRHFNVFLLILDSIYAVYVVPGVLICYNQRKRWATLWNCVSYYSTTTAKK